MEWLVLVFILLLALFLGTLLVLLVYSGLFSRFEVATGRPPLEAVVIAYKFSTGSYRNCGSFFSDSTSIAPEKPQVGIYYDDPEKVPSQKLRWIVGAIISKEDGSVDEELWAKFNKEGYKQILLPTIPASVNTVFPHTTIISIFLAIWRVYPALGRYMQANGLMGFPMIEIYEKGNIFFMAPLSEHMKYFVPETLTEESMESVRQYCSEEEWAMCKREVDSGKENLAQNVSEETEEEEKQNDASGEESDDSFELVKGEDTKE